jgi:probable phosphomutase (TIGR03848 family)
VAELLLIRHAQNDWVKSGRLAGRTPGVHLNEEGKKQAEALGLRLEPAKLQAIYSSPLERARETAEAVASHHPELTVQIEEGLTEVDFGTWTGRRLRRLSRLRLWQIVQHTPSRAIFPGGEAIRDMQNRLINTLEAIASKHGSGKIAVVSHSDVIKAAIAYYAGMPLDMFQRLIISPASISTVYLGQHGPMILQINDTSHYTYQRPNEG